MENDSQVTDAGGNNLPVSAAVLLIVGEPATADHKTLILGEITKGFRTWECEDVDINAELAQIANAADLGAEGPNGERVLNYGTEMMATMVVINGHMETLTAALKNFMSLSAPYKHLIYAGHYFSGNGTWVLQDDTFSISNFAQMCKDKELEGAVGQQNGGQYNFYFSKGGEWKSDSLKKLDIFKNSIVKVSSDEKSIENAHGILQFTTYVASFINAKTSEELLRTSDVVGSIRFNKPTLYIFPGSEGDSSLFGVSGFNLLVNGGFSRKACFWDLTRHLDRIDSFLMTHLGTDNVFGISTLLKRKCTEYIHPEIGYMFLNGSDKVIHSAVVNGQNEKEPSLCINLSEEGSRLIEYAKQLGHVPQPCTRPMSSQPLQPIQLYHKVGHGTLNMYVLNPVSDSKELKEFYQHWNKHLSEHGSMHQIPIHNQLSVCTLLVWQPANPNEKITRIFFPGNTPQYKILEGLEKLKHLDILKHASCTQKDLESKPSNASKRNSLAAKPMAAKPSPAKAPIKSNEPNLSRTTRPEVKRSTEVKTSTERKSADIRSSADRRKPELKKEEAKTAPPPKARHPPPPKTTNKVAKEDENKKMAKKEEKTAKPTKTAAPLSKPAAKAKTESKPKKESPTKAPVEKKEEKKEEVKPEVIEEPPKMEDTPVAIVEPIQDKPLLDLSPNEPVQEEGLVSQTSDQVQEAGSVSQTDESEKADSEPVQEASEPITPDDQPSPADLSPGELMAMTGSGMGNKMMESFHESYHSDLMSNGTPTEEQVQNGAGYGDYDDNVDVQPEALPEPVEIPPQEMLSQPDMIPTSERKNQEEKPLISGMGPIEPDVVQGLQQDPTTSTPIESQAPVDFETSEKTDSDSVEVKQQDPMQRSIFDTDLPENSEPLESITESDSMVSSKTADVPELDQTAEDIMAKSMTDQDQIEDQDVQQGTSPPDVVQVQEKFEEENVVESETKMREVVDEVDEDEISPDENDSQIDVREKVDDDFDENEKLDEEKVVNDESPYAFENKAFADGTSESKEESDSDEGVDNKFTEEENDVTKATGANNVDEQVDCDEQEGNVAANENQFADSLEVSNIPEAFEKDETPDPRDIQSCPSGHLLDINEEETEQPMQSMDPFDPFCSNEKHTDPQTVEEPKHRNLSKSPDERPINGFGFDPYAAQGQNLFGDMEKDPLDEEKELSSNPFDPEAEWGKPMGLPSPPPPDATSKPSDKKGGKTTDVSKNGTKKPPSTNGPSKLNTSKTRPASAAEPKTRPPAASASKRPASAAAASSSRASPATKSPPLPPFHPFYVDLTYIPNHGNPSYSDIEFFKRVRARYYVLSTLSPNPQTLTALMNAKETWENKNAEVTLIPTYDNETLRHWMGLNRDKLNELNIDVAPSAARCTIHLQDHETSCSAYRLEF